MQAVLGDFLRALRAAEIPVSPAEAIDAHRAIATVGYADRILLRDALCSAVAKSEPEAARFTRCFEDFFARDQFRPGTDEEDAGGNAGDTGDAEVGNDSPDPLDSLPEDLPDTPLLRMLAEDDREALAYMMEHAAVETGVSNVRYITQRGLMMRRILVAMGIQDLEAAIAAVGDGGGEGGGGGAGAAENSAATLEIWRNQLLDQARRYVERQIALHARPAAEQLRREFLTETSLSAIERRDLERMHEIIRRMARRLAIRYDRRRRRFRRGQLDLRRTLRRNMAHDGVPFDVEWKRVRIDRPKVAVVCDVSRSVEAASRFLLLFLYSLNEVMARLRAFAFSDRLVEVGDLLEDGSAEQAVPGILDRIGFRPTDYGAALSDFTEQYGDAVDRDTTVVILGDARSNHGEPRVDLMRSLHDRAKAVIWLNPEPRAFWGQGDSEMLRYLPFCHVAAKARTVRDLERVVEDVLRRYDRV